MPEILNKVLKLRNSQISPLKKDLHVELDQSEEEIVGYMLLSQIKYVKSMNKNDTEVV